jgi:sugar lactone lactonase YvrE
LREEVDAALEQMPARLREAVVLRYLEGRDQETAAQVAGCPRGTLARRAVEGLERLRTILLRRGVVVAPAMLAAFLAQESMAAAPPLTWTAAKVSLLAAGLETGRAALLAQSVGKALFWAKIKAYALAVSLAATVTVAAPLVVMEIRRPAVQYQERATLAGPARAVSSWWVAAFSPDGKTLAAAFWDNTIKLWDVPSRQELRTITSSDHAFGCAAFSPDGQVLATGHLVNGAKPFVGVRLWDVATGQVRRNLPGHTQNVYSVAFHPNGKTLVSTCRDGVKFWDVETGVERRSLPKEAIYFNSVACSPDGKTLALGGGSQSEGYDLPGTVRLVDAASGAELASLVGHASFVYTVAFSPDGKTLASGDYQGVVRLWDVASRKQRAVLQHARPVVSLAFARDGGVLAAAAGNHDKGLNWIVQAPGEVKLWDPRAGNELAVMHSTPAPALPVAFSADGRTLVTGAADGTVKLWDVTR